ncbi:MAG TPA: hypothetical protein VJ806_10255 [Luteimonas sp.]|nr:hypothetical protein [Luteimonas sp.]
MLQPVKLGPAGDYARLVFVSEGKQSAGPGNGILSVDGIELSPGTRHLIYVARGKRRIAYDCPDWVVTDGPITLDAEFDPRKSYRLICGSGDPQAQLLTE